MFCGLTLGLVRSCSQVLLCFAADELAAVHRSGQQGLANSQEIRPAAEEAVDFPETPVSHNIIAHPWGRVGWMYAVVSPCGRPA